VDENTTSTETMERLSSRCGSAIVARMGNMVQRVRGDLIVVAHNTDTPSEEEWDRFLEFFRRAHDIDQVRVLVFTDGAAPNTMQRASFTKTLAGKQPRIAVLSGSRVVRGVATAISWFNANIDVFAPDDLGKALDHLRMPTDNRGDIAEIGAALRQQLSRATR
jgi:hypothetical protein